MPIPLHLPKVPFLFCSISLGKPLDGLIAAKEGCWRDRLTDASVWGGLEEGDAQYAIAQAKEYNIWQPTASQHRGYMCIPSQMLIWLIMLKYCVSCSLRGYAFKEDAGGFFPLDVR